MKVQIWSDIVCPWCAIGRSRFAAALADFAHRNQVEVVWRSFELDPAAPRILDQDLTDHLAAKYGMDRAGAAQMQARMTQVAADEGLDFHFERARSGNTFDAHRLLHLAAARGRQDAAKERLLTAYLSEGQPIGDPETLVRLVAEVGVDADEARAVLAGDAYADAVRADEREARALGITGVPFFVVDRRYGVSGAQPSEVLLEVLERAWSDTHALAVIGAPAGDGCTDDSCAI